MFKGYRTSSIIYLCIHEQMHIPNSRVCPAAAVCAYTNKSLNKCDNTIIRYSGTWELGTPKGLWKTVLNSEVVLFLRFISLYWMGLETEVAVLNSHVDFSAGLKDRFHCICYFVLNTCWVILRSNFWQEKTIFKRAFAWNIFPLFMPAGHIHSDCPDLGNADEINQRIT